MQETSASNPESYSARIASITRSMELHSAVAVMVIHGSAAFVVNETRLNISEQPLSCSMILRMHPCRPMAAPRASAVFGTHRTTRYTERCT